MCRSVALDARGSSFGGGVAIGRRSRSRRLGGTVLRKARLKLRPWSDSSALALSVLLKKACKNVDSNELAGGKAAVGTLPQSTRRDFRGVSYDEAMRRAREIVPVLRERAQRAEDARLLLRENEQLLHEAGLFRIHQPRVFGGMELDFVAVVDIPSELARGCPSTAWNVGNLASHHWLLGYYSPEAQHEVWDANPDVLIASSVALAAGRGRKAEGGFVVSGRWPFSSGVDNSDWNMLAVTVHDEDGKTPIDWRLCLVPKSDYTIIDTWFAMGAAATGSKDVAVDELFVPVPGLTACADPWRT